MYRSKEQFNSNIEYVVAVEHEVFQNNKIVHGSISYILKYGPDTSKAKAYFHKEIDSEYTNVYGVTNRVWVRSIYRKVDI